MKIVCISNFLNHHQVPFAEAIRNMKGIEYYFIASTPVDDERLKMGYTDFNSKVDYVLRPYESSHQKALSRKLVKEADIALIGDAPVSYLDERIRSRKLVFRVFERHFKEGFAFNRFPRNMARVIKHRLWLYQFYPLYYLALGAYVSADLNHYTNFNNKVFRWAYFVESRKIDLAALEEKKQNRDFVKILWVGRFLSWKHPDIAIQIAKRLKDDGVHFQMTLIGNGEMHTEVCRMLEDRNLRDNVKLIDFISPSEVREYMEDSDIFLSTSDFLEGWGAVINESMSSGCATVASHACGAAPYLIKDGTNGFMYENGNVDSLYKRVVSLISDKDLRMKISRNAFNDIRNIWSPQNGAERFLCLADAIKNKQSTMIFQDGPCSPAPVLKNDWYSHLGKE